MSEEILRVKGLNKVYVTLWQSDEIRKNEPNAFSAQFFVYGMERAKKERDELLRLSVEEGYPDAVCTLREVF